MIQRLSCQTVDSETLRIIYQQIQELSNMGNNVQAQLLREFVDTKLVPEKLSSSMNFDESFELWKVNQMKMAVNELAMKWGLNSYLLEKPVCSYSNSQPDVVPYIDEIIQSVDFDAANNQACNNRLMHVMKLTRYLPELIAEIKQRYN